MKIYFIILALTLPLWSQIYPFYLLPNKDSYVQQNNPNGNYGTAGHLYICSNNSSDNTIARSLIRFNFPYTNPNYNVLFAELQVTMFDHAGTDFEIEVHNVLEPWNELTVTWDSQPSYETECAAILPYHEDNWTFDITDLVRYWADAPSMNHGLMLKLSVEQYPDSIGRGAYFYSRDTSSSLQWDKPSLSGYIYWYGVMEDENTVSNFKGLTLKPNPTRGFTSLSLNITRDIPIQIAMYDIMGSEIRKIYDDIVYKGNLTIPINTGNLASGTYFIKVNAGNYQNVKPLVIIK
jgi:hypothetical protein